MKSATTVGCPAKVRRRDGTLVRFDIARIEAAVARAAREVAYDDPDMPVIMARAVADALGPGIAPVEEIQDFVEARLGEADLDDVARAYIIWTMPGNEATIGHLTSEFHRIVTAARVSVTCATYNFSANSNMWDVLKSVSEQPDLTVCIYVDADKGDPCGVKTRLPRASVYRSAHLPDGSVVVSHTKFVIVDHEVVLLTSANFSYSAENRNVEFGLLIQDNGLATSIETTMASKRGSLYELV